MEKLIINNLTKHYNNKLIFKEVSFELSPGEIILLTGDNGSGKTTLLNIIFGWLKPDSGNIIYGSDITHVQAYNRVRKGFSYMPQDSYQLESKTVKENLQFAITSLKSDYAAPTPDIESFFNSILSINKIENQKIGSLSRGERRKVQFRISLLNNADIYIYDEPISGWDMDSRNEAYKIFQLLKDTGKSLIICEHDLSSELLNICDHILVLFDSKMKYFETKDDFFNEHHTDVTMKRNE